MLFGFVIPFTALHTYVRYKQTGNLPMQFQGQYYLFRNNLSYYGWQQEFNCNPDNHYSRVFNYWTSDPTGGLDVAPKRPFQDLKDPKATMVKFKRAPEESMRQNAIGWR